jgi:cytidylate kinase
VAPPQEALRQLIRDAITEIARRGDAVIVAHAASLALAGEKDLLRVLITGSAKARARRLWLTGALINEEDAGRAVAESDRERQLYLERFFRVREELPTHYDLVINTDVLQINQAVEAIVAAAQA